MSQLIRYNKHINYTKGICNYSAVLYLYRPDRKKMIQEYKNPIAAGGFTWIFTCKCEGTEPLQQFHPRKDPGNPYDSSHKQTDPPIPTAKTRTARRT
ncbi:hypothetical protein CE91St56_46360 [Lachnospiraceae bacterium]|nr:hypothetical protein CE91St56_46360 [Lachnospiraceae bacterium]GKH43588.1 hypothetical protein CE91St57_45620 [Lachnospiraceae bacterium]